jgi:hypothetical protein
VRLGDRKAVVLRQHVRIAAVLLGVERRPTEDLGEPYGDVVGMFGVHPAEDRLEQVVLPDLLVEGGG